MPSEAMRNSPDRVAPIRRLRIVSEWNTTYTACVPETTPLARFSEKRRTGIAHILC